MMLAAGTLWIREMVRFYRQPSRIVGALGSPFVFWLLIGSGVGTSFSAGQTKPVTYLQYFFPGTLLMILLFTAIFSTISLIEDRREGFLQSVLIAPVPRGSLVLGKILGGSTLAFFQGVLFLAISPFIGIRWDMISLAETGVVLFLNAFALTALGFLIAWKLHSIQGFHAIMNLFLLPMWLLSGALFPPDGAPGWLKAVMHINPLTYGLAALRFSLSHGSVPASTPGFAVSVAMTAAFGIVLFAAGSIMAGRRDEGSLP